MWVRCTWPSRRRGGGRRWVRMRWMSIWVGSDFFKWEATLESLMEEEKEEKVVVVVCSCREQEKKKSNELMKEKATGRRKAREKVSEMPTFRRKEKWPLVPRERTFKRWRMESRIPVLLFGFVPSFFLEWLLECTFCTTLAALLPLTFMRCISPFPFSLPLRQHWVWDSARGKKRWRSKKAKQDTPQESPTRSVWFIQRQIHNALHTHTFR